MNSARRSLIALGLMSVGLAVLLVNSMGEGWTTLRTLGVACLVVAIAAQLVALRRPGASPTRPTP